MLKEYAGKVTMKIDGIAASAASVIAMSGDEVYMSPVANMMIHNPATIAIGDSEEMLRAKRMLDEVKESIINAYEIKSKQSRDALSEMMNTEFWMDAHVITSYSIHYTKLYDSLWASPVWAGTA